MWWLNLNVLYKDVYLINRLFSYFRNVEFLFHLSTVLADDPDIEDCPACEATLADLENIDDDTDRAGIQFVKTTDDSVAADYGITKFPALIYFENNIPSIYEGRALLRSK